MFFCGLVDPFCDLVIQKTVNYGIDVLVYTESMNQKLYVNVPHKRQKIKRPWWHMIDLRTT